MAEASTAERLPINGRVLRWARERRSYDIEEAARRVNVTPDRVAGWESGDGTPTVKQARRLAEFYDRPFLEFFARDLPSVKETELVPDFRLHRGEERKETAALREIQAWAEETRLNMLDLLEMVGERPTRFPEELYASVNEDVESVAARARKLSGVPVEWQRRMRAADRDSFPSVLRKAFERLGVLVLRQSAIQALNARGICLFAEPLPIIVYGGESPGAQAFTLAHEFAHIILRQSAISGAPRLGGRSGIKQIESWCNQFAGAFLMPEKAIREDVKPSAEGTIDDEQLAGLAKRYAVSRHAMLVRLVAIGLIRPSFYWFVKRPQFLKEEEEYSSGARSKYYGSRYRSSHGDLYTGLVLEAWSSGAITNHNAAEFMGINNLAHLNDIRDHFGD